MARLGEVLAALANDQLQDERQSKASLAQRAALVISTSGTLVTLLLGAAALVTKAPSFIPPHYIQVETAAAAVLFILAAIVALLVNVPWTQDAVDIDTLRSVHYKGLWGADEHETQEMLHDVRLDLIIQLRGANKWRAWGLIAALSLESIAVVVLAIGLLQILL